MIGFPKPASRLEDKTVAKRESGLQERHFRLAVWFRDESKCRCCGRKVRRTIDRVANRGEVHHIHGKIGKLRYEIRAALLLCASCHEKVTGRVNERLAIKCRKTFRSPSNLHFIDATYSVTFTRTV